LEPAEVRKKADKTITEGDLSDPRNSCIGVSKPTKRRITARRSEKVERRPKIRKNQEMKRKRWNLETITGEVLGLSERDRKYPKMRKSTELDEEEEEKICLEEVEIQLRSKLVRILEKKDRRHDDVGYKR
jgi:hypothetical protein